ncbi:hypothetical protein ABKV19_026108 [Rosa sericea]
MKQKGSIRVIKLMKPYSAKFRSVTERFFMELSIHPVGRIRGQLLMHWMDKQSKHISWEKREKAAYTQHHIDAVRTEWAKFVVKIYM